MKILELSGIEVIDEITQANLLLVDIESITNSELLRRQMLLMMQDPGVVGVLYEGICEQHHELECSLARCAVEPALQVELRQRARQVLYRLKRAA